MQKSPLDVTADDIRLYMVKRQLEDKVSNVTVNNERRALSSLFNWMQKEEIRLKNPMIKIDAVKEAKKKKHAFTEYEIEVMRNSLKSTKDKAIYEVLVSSWARVSEVAQIRLDELEGDKVTVHGKGQKDRIVYLNASRPFAIKSDDYANMMSYLEYEVKEYVTTDLDNVNNTYTDGLNIYFMRKQTITSGATFILYKFNTEDMTLTEITIKNQTEKTLFTSFGFEVYNDYLYTGGYNDRDLYEININNPADTNIYATGATSYLNFNKLVNLGNGKIFIQSNARVIVFDAVTKNVKYTKHYMSSGYRVCNQSICMIYDINASAPSKAIRYIPAMYLATINNLDKPVTKTADKTMKVTYSIQEV